MASNSKAIVNGDGNIFIGGQGSSLIDNASNGSSKVEVFGPTSAIASDTQTYTGANGSGQMLQDFIDYTNGMEAQINDSYNTAGQLTQTTQQDTFANIPVTITDTTQLDGNGNVIGDSGPSLDYSGSIITGSALASDFGSQLGSLLGGSNIFAKIGDATLGSTILGNLFATNNNLGASLLAAATDGSGNTVLGAAVNNSFEALGQSAVTNLTSQTENTLSGLLIGEAAQALNLNGFGGEVFTASGETITQQLVSNITNSNIGVNNLLYGFNAESLIENFGINLGLAVGNALGNELIDPTSIGQELFTSLGGLEGGIAGTTIGVEVAASLENCLAPGIASTIASTGIAEALGSMSAIILPGLGAVLGSVIGDVAGDAVFTLLNDITGGWLGRIFGGGSVYDFIYDDFSGNQFTAGAEFSKNTTAALRQGTYDLNNSYMATVNAMIDTIGGIVDLNALGNSRHTDFCYDKTAQQYCVQLDADDSVIAANGDFDYIERLGVENQLSQMVFDTGDLIKLRAFYAWQSTVTSITGNSLVTLTADMQIASDYENYLANTSQINALMAAEPDSSFAVGWLATLLQAQALGLNNLNATYNWATGGSQVMSSINLPSNETSVLESYTGANATGALTYEMIDFNDGTSQEQIYSGLGNGVSRELLTYSGTNTTGTLTQEIIDYTAGTSQLQLFNPSGAISSKIEDFSGLDGNGILNDVTINFTNGTSQRQLYTNLDSGVAGEFLNYSGANATGTLTDSIVNFTNGLSWIRVFNPTSTVNNKIDLYSGLNATGIIVEETITYNAGNSTDQLFYQTGTYSSTLANYAGAADASTLNSMIYNWTAGGSQELVYTGLPSGVTLETLNYSAANATGALTQETINYSTGTSQVELFNPTNTISTEFENFSGLNGSGTLTSTSINLVGSNSHQQVSANLPSNVTGETLYYAGANDTGTVTGSIVNFTNGLSWIRVFNPTSAINNIVDLYSKLNATGNMLEETIAYNAGNSTDQLFYQTGSYSSILTSYAGAAYASTVNSIIYNWTAGGSQELVYTGLPSGVTLETLNYSGANATGSLTSTVFAGSAGNDTLTANTSSNETLAGNGGYDIYQFARGDGMDNIQNGISTNITSTSELDFGAGITANQLWLMQVGNNLQIDIMGTHDQITISGWYANAQSQLQEIKTSDGSMLDSQLNQLVQAMATYSSTHAGFDPTAITQAPADTALQAALATAWHH